MTARDLSRRVHGVRLQRHRWTHVRVRISRGRLAIFSHGRQVLATVLTDRHGSPGPAIPALPPQPGLPIQRDPAPEPPAPPSPSESHGPPSDAPGASQSTGTPSPRPTDPSAPVPTSPLRLFAPDSVWNAAVPPDAPLDPSSTSRLAAFNAQIDRERASGIGPWINDSEYSTPIYVVGPDTPRTPVKLDGDNPSLQAALGQGVPIPPGARPATGYDHHLAIYQPSSDTLWEFWHARSLDDGWHADWGGAMQNASSNPGYYTSQAWPGLAPSQGWNWGASASSLPITAGTITLDDLRSGHINHALALAVPNPCGGEFSWPAQRTDGSATGPDCMPEGAHLRLDPTLDVSSLNVPPVTKMLAEAAQRYGIVVRDRTYYETTFYTEDPTPSGTELHGPNGLYGGVEPWTFVPRFPWASLQLLKLHECAAAPCSSGA